MKKVLLIEDDPEILGLLEIHLKDLEFEVIKSMDGAEGLDLLLTTSPDLVILDISLPSMDGFEVCKRARTQTNVPIIMLTAKSEEIDRVLGLEVGADDYITKPFSVREFIARVKGIFRRANMIKESYEGPQTQLRYDGLEIDVEKRKVLVRDEKVDLSPKEFELLVLLASKPGKSFGRRELLSLVWGYDFDGYEHTVNSHINRLRAKIEEDMANPRFILTSWGVGYTFNEEI